MKILIVDDSRAMRALIRRMLHQSDYYGATVYEAEDGCAALEAIRRFEPDLVLANWNMPQMSGIDLLEAIQSDHLGVPLGFITSDGSASVRERARAAGAQFLISKPFTLDSLQSAVGMVQLPLR